MYQITHCMKIIYQYVISTIPKYVRIRTFTPVILSLEAQLFPAFVLLIRSARVRHTSARLETESQSRYESGIKRNYPG